MTNLIRLHTIRCLEEVNEASASEEIYALITAVDMRPPNLPIRGLPPAPNFEVFRYGVFENFDEGDIVTVGDPACWGPSSAPLDIAAPDHAAIIVSLMEHDNGSPEQYQALVRTTTALSLAGSAGEPNQALRAARLARTIGDNLNGVDLPIPFALDDDHIGTQQLMLDGSDLFEHGEKQKVMRFETAEGRYELVFRVIAGGWNSDWFPLPGQHVFDHQRQRITAVARSPHNLDLFVIGFDNKVYTTFWPNNGQWNGDWFPLPGQHVFDHQRQRIAAVARSPHNLDLFVIGFDNKAYTTFWP